MSYIKTENLTYEYTKGVKALKNVNIGINKGEYVAIIGHNGSGKSTLAKLFNGLLQPTSGKVFVNGTDTSDKQKLFDVRKTVGVVFQNPDNQLVASIVEDDLAFGPENLGVPREEIGKRIDYALKACDIEKFRNSTPSKLSGGQKQRVAIAGVLAVMPEVMIFDEATAMLDPKGRNEVLSVSDKLNKENGITVINITHYMDEVVRADRVIVLNDGEVYAEGTPEEIFKRADELESLGLSVPTACRIALDLKKKGVDLGEPLTDEELGDKLCELFAKI
ncbi:MAG: energy-coupling factor transporter ATPase [Clostridia bacterium]|nr:energy-coupling factor transporter ATPase [Clostridia bacterium]